MISVILWWISASANSVNPEFVSNSSIDDVDVFYFFNNEQIIFLTSIFQRMIALTVVGIAILKATKATVMMRNFMLSAVLNLQQ